MQWTQIRCFNLPTITMNIIVFRNDIKAAVSKELKALRNGSLDVAVGTFVTVNLELTIWDNELSSGGLSMGHPEIITYSFISVTVDYQMISFAAWLENGVWFIGLFSSVNCWSLPKFTETANHTVFKIIHINNMNLKAFSFFSWQLQTADSHTFSCQVCLTSHCSLIVSFQNKNWNWKAQGENAVGEMKVSICYHVQEP